MNKETLICIENIKKYLYDVFENGQYSENTHIRLDYQTVMNYVGHVLKFYATVQSSPVAKLPSNLVVEKCSFSDHKNNDFSTMHLSYPHFLLDKIFLHKEKLDNNVLEQAIILLEIIEGMYYYVLNRIDELEFDLKHIPENIEWKYNTLCFSQYWV